MGLELSAFTVSSLDFSIIPLEYQNIERQISFLSSGEYFAITDDCLDVKIDENKIIFITDFSKINDYCDFENLKTNTYFYDTADPYLNYSLEIKENQELDIQFLITSPLNDDALKCSIIPLKNHIDKTNEFINKPKIYDKLYVKNNQIFLQYKHDRILMEIEPDNYQTITLGKNIDNFFFSKEDVSKSYKGESPANSDNIFIDGRNTLNIVPNFSTSNGELLCVWFSDDEILTRWYNPDSISQEDAMLAENNDQLIQDIPLSSISSLSACLTAKTSFAYKRYGEDQNSTFIDSFSSDLRCHFDSFSSIITDKINNISGFIVGEYAHNSKELILSGKEHAHIPPNEFLHKDYNTTISLWAYSDDWSCGVDTQFWGNFSNSEGYGLFYNTGSPNTFITFPSIDGMIYGFNHKGYRVFEKNLLSSLNVSDVHITKVLTTYFESRWLYDDLNKKIYKLEVDDLISNIIELPETSNISQMLTNSKDILYILDTTSSEISSFDKNGVFISSTSVNSNITNFEIDYLDNIHPMNTSNIVSDKNNNIYFVKGFNLYKNNNIWYHFNTNISKLLLDAEDNIYVFQKNNTITKLNSNADVIWSQQINLPVINETVEMSFVKENINNCDEDILWIVFNEYAYVLKIDPINGQIIKRLLLKNAINAKGCNILQLTTSGDFSGYNVKRKYEQASSLTPAFSLKLNLKCDNNKIIYQTFHPATSYIESWIHFAFNHEIKENKTYIRFYINGHKITEDIFDGVYMIDFDTKSSPFIIGGNSGKLGAKNVEKSIIHSGYFKGQISDIRIYNTYLSDKKIKALANHQYWKKWHPMILPIPTSPRSYIEQIEKFHLNKYPGYKSNRFNIIIKGLPLDYEKDEIISFIQRNIENIKPANSYLNEIVFK